MVQTLQPTHTASLTFHRTGGMVHGDRVDWAGGHTPGFIALSAGIGHEPAFLVKREHFDAGFGGVEKRLRFHRSTPFRTADNRCTYRRQYEGIVASVGPRYGDLGRRRDSAKLPGSHATVMRDKISFNLFIHKAGQLAKSIVRRSNPCIHRIDRC